MRSTCMAVSPLSTCSYAWKLPVTPQTRPAFIDQTHNSPSRSEASLRREAVRPECSSISWKTYLALRELKILASNLTDAVFSPSSTSLSSQETERPSSLHALPIAQAGQHSAGLLASSVLPDAGEVLRVEAEQQIPGLALAA